MQAKPGKWKVAGLVAGLSLICLAAWGLTLAWADHDGHEKKDRDKHRSRSTAATPAQLQAYKQECGACHMAYPPWLLPAGSWEKILSRPKDHFGEQLTLEAPTLAAMKEYLLAGAADKSDHKRARKIMKSLGSSLPARISEIGYLRDKHHEVAAEVWARKSVGGLANCLACHPGAEAGDFDDDAVSIPR